MRVGDMAHCHISVWLLVCPFLEVILHSCHYSGVCSVSVVQSRGCLVRMVKLGCLVARWLRRVPRGSRFWPHKDFFLLDIAADPQQITHMCTLLCRTEMRNLHIQKARQWMGHIWKLLGAHCCHWFKSVFTVPYPTFHYGNNQWIKVSWISTKVITPRFEELWLQPKYTVSAQNEWPVVLRVLQSYTKTSSQWQCITNCSSYNTSTNWLIWSIRSMGKWQPQPLITYQSKSCLHSHLQSL